MSARITDAGGQVFSIRGCDTVSQLKESILEHTGIPVEQQQLCRAGVNVKTQRTMKDDEEIVENEELTLLVKNMNGGCEVRPFYIKIQNFECKFRCSICYNGIDCDWSKCQYCCVHAGCTIQ